MTSICLSVCRGQDGTKVNCIEHNNIYQFFKFSFYVLKLICILINTIMLFVIRKNIKIVMVNCQSNLQMFEQSHPVVPKLALTN
jgi:hypothetical protein